MPITKQAIKRVRQDKVKTARNQHYNNQMKSMIKLFLGYIQEGEFDKATKILPKVVSSIDTCVKKNLLHQNNAAHKKSRLQKALSNKDKTTKVVSEKPVKAEKKVSKKVAR